MKVRRNGFTLIELLVVIAIIAILAAILFPVFAQAREKARAISCLSNTKQMSLAILMYQQDYDEVFPSGFNDGIGWVGGQWPQYVQPYIKDGNFNIFKCPDDALSGLIHPESGQYASFTVYGISYAANGATGTWCCAPTWSSGYAAWGPMQFQFPTAGGWGMTQMTGPMTDAQVTQPAATILLAEKHNSDVNAAYTAGAYGGDSGGTIYGNYSDYLPICIISGAWMNGNPGMGPSLIPHDPGGTFPTYPATFTFGSGPNGSVSASHNNMGNFAFTDGHSKAMIPTATNPDPNNQPQNNMWNATR